MDIEKLKKDIETVACWRKFGKSLNEEQQRFANNLAEQMIAAKCEKQVGVQLISKANVDFVKKGIIEKELLSKGMQPTQESNAVAGITQDVVANVHSNDGKFPKKTKIVPEEDKEVIKGGPGSGPKGGENKSEKESTKFLSPRERAIYSKGREEGLSHELAYQDTMRTRDDDERIANKNKNMGKALPTSASESGKLPRNTPDIFNIKQECPKDCKCGEVNAVADSKTDPKQLSQDHKGTIAIEEIGHQPNLPMPKKMAEELVRNAEWGVEIGAYGDMTEAIERMLGSKQYAEFVDTDDKLKSVLVYLEGLTGK